MNTSERTLVIDCATTALSVALFEGDRLLASHHVELGRGHAEALLPAIAGFPGSGRATQILVDVGPGSFTGVRVGLAAARALGFAWDAPVSGYDCLDLVGAIVRADYRPVEPFIVAMIGGHGELFWKRLPPQASSPSPAPVSTPIGELADILGDEAIYGSGAPQLIAARNGHGLAVPVLPDTRRIMLLPSALRSLPATPIYGRGADAKPMASLSAQASPVQ
ncbi:tRNA (adenosine(37)-N6)-threonylcarbamoyltransferase complex dimerization subunit type 1 TsaB [Sphingobium sp. CR28]|uniref:tRNA (adenosine(37)-N6)-threonylcarbamoyltransferase complex dimerization subunit type 1 TsaB n=1 Tax=Sphingobium sp. CR28 TaxID=3400272 RepID=UPI003FEEAAEF